MRIAATTAYAPSIQSNRNSQPSFNGNRKGFWNVMCEAATKPNGKERPMTPKSFAGFCALVGGTMVALGGVFATCTEFCHHIGVCLGKY